MNKHTEFPKYCVLDGASRTVTDSAPVDGCGPCTRYDCFGNPNYRGMRTKAESTRFDNWRVYISKQEKAHKKSNRLSAVHDIRRV
jgi:hypothetical protein